MIECNCLYWRNKQCMKGNLKEQNTNGYCKLTKSTKKPDYVHEENNR